MGADDLQRLPALLKGSEVFAFGARSRVGRDLIGHISRTEAASFLVLSELRGRRRELAVTSMRKWPATMNVASIAATLNLNAQGDDGLVSKVIARS